MDTNERLMGVAKLRLRFRMNNRLRLESLAMLSRVFREHQEPIADELLSSLVFAVPDELIGEAEGISGSTEIQFAQKAPKDPPHHKHPPSHPPSKKHPPSHPPSKNHPPSHPPSKKR
jgi:hypothetical protein